LRLRVQALGFFFYPLISCLLLSLPSLFFFPRFSLSSAFNVALVDAHGPTRIFPFFSRRAALGHGPILFFSFFFFFFFIPSLRFLPISGGSRRRSFFSLYLFFFFFFFFLRFFFDVKKWREGGRRGVLYLFFLFRCLRRRVKAFFF